MVGTLEDGLARLKVELGEEMTDFDRAVVGAFGSKNLRIPMTSAVNLRRVADIMRGLATDLERLSKRGDLAARTIILEAGWCVNQANAKIRALPGRKLSRGIQSTD